MEEQNVLKEQIYLAPGANGWELVKSRAMYGKNSANLCICGAGELARKALMCSGIAITEEIMDPRDEISAVSEALSRIDKRGEAYFKTPTYADLQAITAAIRKMRNLVVDADEESRIKACLELSPFREKNTALFAVYQEYMKICEEKNQIDSVSLVRKALAECGKMNSADFFLLTDSSFVSDEISEEPESWIVYPLSPLEKALLEKLSEGQYTKQTLREFYGADEKPLHLECIRECYGAPNEVEMILTDIYRDTENGKKRPDECTVAVTDPDTYGQLFFDYALLYNIPVTIGCGVPIINSNPAKLLTLYRRWMTEGFFGAVAFRDMLRSSAFDKAKLLKAWTEFLPEDHEVHKEAPEGETEAERRKRRELLSKQLWSEFSAAFYSDVPAGLRFRNDSSINEKCVSDFKKAVIEEEAKISPDDEQALKEVEKKKQCFPLLDALAKVLALPAEDFIYKYTRIRHASDKKATNAEKLTKALDIAARSAIYEELKGIHASNVKQAEEDTLLNALQKRVSIGKAEGGYLFVTDFKGALASVRKNLYIAGLSASNYPGTPRENHLLLDADLNAFGKAAGYLCADELIERKRKALLSLVHLASALDSRISVSYSGMNVSELKKANKSSLVFELFKESNGTDVASETLDKYITKVAYFEPAISVTRKIGEAYNAGIKIGTEPAAAECEAENDNTETAGPDAVSADDTSDVTARDVVAEDNICGADTPDETPDSEENEGNKEEQPLPPIPPEFDRAYSPSALSNFFNCPRQFYLSNIMGIREPDEEDPLEVIPANATGTLAHSLMEALADDKKMDLTAFQKLAGEAFDRYLLEHPPVIQAAADDKRQEFLEMMTTAFHQDPRRDVTLKEEDISCLHEESGVKIHGFPDRVEVNEKDGTLLIVDFKSGRKNEHKPDDIDTCLQVVIYAYLIEHFMEGKKVSGGEFRYIRLGEEVPCKYDDDMKIKLKEKLLEFRKHLVEKDFPVSENALHRDSKDTQPDPCKYCKFGQICGKAFAAEGGDENE